MDDPLATTVVVSTAALGLPGTRSIEVAGVVPRGPRLAIVGSRAARADRAAAVAVVVAAARQAGLSIVSGGALGIDAAAHQAALALGVPQIAVLPCGPDRPYPPAHVPLFRRILATGGAVVFGRPRGTPPNRGVFASRNAIVVGLCDRIVVAQAGVRSGSLSTGRMALGARKPLAVLAGQAAAAALVDGGAALLPWPAPDDALAAAVHGWIADAPCPAAPWPDDLQALRGAVQAAGPAGLSIDALGPALLLALVRAETDGWVGERTPGRYVALR